MTIPTEVEARMHASDGDSAAKNEAMQCLLKVVEEAGRQELISVTASRDEIVYSITIPRKESGRGLDLFMMAHPLQI